MKKKNLLIYAHYFYPDVASTAQILTELAQGLKDSFNITVICVVPSYGGRIERRYKKRRYYKESYEGIKIIRVRVPEFRKSKKISRIKNIISYFLNSIAVTLKMDKQDYIFAISQPPILGGMLGVIGKWIKGGKFIYNIQDFNPEQSMAVGYVKSKRVTDIALKLDKFNCKHADEIIVVGRDMQETLKNRFQGKKVPSNIFINNWIDENEIYPIPQDNRRVVRFKEEYGLKDKFVIMYSGNIGLYYDLINIVKVMARFKDRQDVVFAFVGDGTVKKDIEDYVIKNDIRNIKFIPYQKKCDLKYSLNSADIHLVVNAKGIKGVSVPSKLYGVMACGKSIFGILDEDSEARIIMKDSNCGICAEPGNYEDIYKKMKYILDNRKCILEKGCNGRKYLEEKLSKELSISKYRESILSV